MYNVCLPLQQCFYSRPAECVPPDRVRNLHVAGEERQRETATGVNYDCDRNQTV